MNLTIAAILYATSLAIQPPVVATDVLQPLRFLVGSWDAKTEGGSAQAQGAGEYSFQLELQGHVLARHSSYADCQGPAAFNCQHGDLLYVYPDTRAGFFKAIYFDNEGHVIHYDVTSPSPGVALFLSEPTASGPQFRLRYELKDGTMTGRFELRMPGQADFSPYLQWSGRQTTRR